MKPKIIVTIAVIWKGICLSQPHQKSNGIWSVVNTYKVICFFFVFFPYIYLFLSFKVLISKICPISKYHWRIWNLQKENSSLSFKKQNTKINQCMIARVRMQMFQMLRLCMRYTFQIYVFKKYLKLWCK